MLQTFRFTLLCLILSLSIPVAQAKATFDKSPPAQQTETLQCTGFSPYVGTLTPNYGGQPSKALINALLDKLIADTPFRCIMTYGVLNGLDYTFTAAKARNLKVIAILWIDKDPEVNTQSINKGIEVAKAFPDTIIKLSCGSEVRTRHGYAFDGEITRCIDRLRKASVSQPITTIDTWWEWCNRKTPCETSVFGAQVDWIGTNIFPWWENKFSQLFPCTPAKKAADFHIARLETLHQTYPKKPIVVTEFGWPSGPKNSTESNNHSNQTCGIPTKENQILVINETFVKLGKKHWSGVAFEAFGENWKPSSEGNAGSFWGICDGTPPFNCPKNLHLPKLK